MTRLVTLDRRTAAVAAIVALLLALLPMPGTPSAHADGSAEARLSSLLASHRAANGRAALRSSGELAAVARRHAQRMADGDHLHHNPNLGGAVSNWRKVGENVGRGPNADRIQEGWRNSGSHNANMLDGEWVEFGIGAVVKDGQLWAVQIFRVPADQPAAAPQPAPEPASTPASTGAETPSAASSSGAASGDASGGAADGAPAATSAPSDAPERAPDPEPEPEPEPEPHEVPDVAPGADQLSVVLARLESRHG